MKMHPHACLFLLIFAFLNTPLKIECKSKFGIGYRQDGDQLLLRDQLENRHTGVTEVPMIAFNYAIKDTITYIEIVSNENVLADVIFSYNDTLINGTVSTLSSMLEAEKEPFSIAISIYGFNETIPEIYDAEVLQENLYQGTLFPDSDPSEIDHMEHKDEDEDDEDDEDENESVTANFDLLETEEFVRRIDTQTEDGRQQDADKLDDQDEDYEVDEQDFESFNMDKVITHGHRQMGDYLLFETFQTSATTMFPTSHYVTFYYIDSAYITYIEFVLIDYNHNKTKDEIENSFMTEYSHFSPSTLKAIVRDNKTTSAFVRMSIYGYLPEDLPTGYTSYIPERVRGVIEEARFSTESPETHLRSQINALQRDSIARLPSSFDMLRREGEFENTVAKIDENNESSNSNGLRMAKRTNIPFVMLSMGFVVFARILWSRLV